MENNGTEFSKYATAFYNIIEGGKGGKAKFVKMLLKMGLTDEDKDYIDDTFPTVINSKGQNSVVKGKADVLLKYLRGDNDISYIVSQLETEFNLEFRKRYIEELQDYDESKLTEFAKKLELDINADDSETVSNAIADYYSSLIERASTKKGGTSKKSKDKPKSDEQNLIDSYTIKDDEKKAINNICTAIKADLRQLKSQVKYISSNQRKIGKLTDSDPDKLQKPHLEGFIESKTNKFNETYSDLVSQCLELNTIIAPKKKMNKSFATLVSITSILSSDEYKEMSIDRFITHTVQLKVNELDRYIKYSLKEIDMQ